ncbi:hypothetical protein B296_00009525 [Ensete ventricosum]|uniref:Protein kinase domain-containing protein n=1 Tax=Ensete ventricosum TaxID=4639 RepID=A0A427A490_ENSVE|nr:hypothetical protein B296_00009525 [Ensete ventricosum]
MTTTGKLSSLSSSTFGQSTGSGVSVDDVFPEGRILEVPNLRIFTFAELRSATRGFKPEAVLGEGGFGRVYKGWVEEKTLNPAKSGLGMVVAVKKLNHESMQGLEEWQVISLCSILCAFPFCFLFSSLLFRLPARSPLSKSFPFYWGAAFEPLSWSIRLKMAIGAARGLAFLHSSDKQVIYRDFKASNILLDANYNAKLSDFGLAKHGPTGGDSHVTTRVMGTYGYAAPEYVATGIDVYGFGVVLLEMLSGQRALDTNRPSGQHNLVDWARPMLADRRKLARLMDPRLEGQYSSKGAFQAAQLTLSCLAGDPKSRPSMKVVVETLERIEAIKGRSREARDASLQPVVARSRGHTPVQGRSPPHPRHENAGPGVAAATHQPHRPS